MRACSPRLHFMAENENDRDRDSGLTHEARGLDRDYYWDGRVLPLQVRWEPCVLQRGWSNFPYRSKAPPEHSVSNSVKVVCDVMFGGLIDGGW